MSVLLALAVLVVPIVLTWVLRRYWLGWLPGIALVILSVVVASHASDQELPGLVWIIAAFLVAYAAGCFGIKLAHRRRPPSTSRARGVPPT